MHIPYSNNYRTVPVRLEVGVVRETVVCRRSQRRASSARARCRGALSPLMMLLASHKRQEVMRSQRVRTLAPAHNTPV